MRIIATLAALLLVSPAIAADGGDAAKPAPPAKEKKICKVGANTGTRFSTRTCKTEAEWTADRLAAQRDLEFRQRSDYNQTRSDDGL